MPFGWFGGRQEISSVVEFLGSAARSWTGLGAVKIQKTHFPKTDLHTQGISK
jgi:hypothetical protein